MKRRCQSHGDEFHENVIVNTDFGNQGKVFTIARNMQLAQQRQILAHTPLDHA